MNFSTHLFRAHAVGKIMSNGRGKDSMGETCKSYLKQIYLEVRYGRKKDIHSKYITKGLETEESAITLYSRVKKKFYRKNTERISNSYLSGEPDLYEGETILSATHGIDTKASWDLFTHPTPGDKLNPDYFYQAQSYMALTGANTWTIAHCLVDTPLILIEDEKRRLMYKMGALTNESPEYLAACEELEKNMTFSDIPLKERVTEFFIDRDDAVIEKIYERIEDCRKYLNDMELKMNPGAIIAEYDNNLQTTIIQ
jgi:hypothetical protein